MKRFAAIIVASVTIVLTASAEQWIWKNDSLYDRYKMKHHPDFGLLIEGGEIVYRRLFTEPAMVAVLGNMPLNQDYLDPIRLVDGDWVDLSKKYKLIELSHFLSMVIPGYRNPKLGEFMPEWECVSFTVFQVLSGDGLLFFKGGSRSTNGPYFLELSKTDDIADGDQFRWMLLKGGTKTYATTGGSEKTVHRYYYGYVPKTKAGWEEAVRAISKDYQKEDGTEATTQSQPPSAEPAQ